MRCPVCKSHESHSEIRVHVNGLDEDLFQCDSCESTWSVNHGLVEIVKDTQRSSFLEANSEAVDGADNS
jgi:GTP cyclohydrolase II